MSDDGKQTPDDAPDVVRLARVRDKLLIKRQDVEAEALARRFHDAMGWQGKGGKKGSKRRKPRP